MGCAYEITHTIMFDAIISFKPESGELRQWEAHDCYFNEQGQLVAREAININTGTLNPGNSYKPWWLFDSDAYSFIELKG